MEHIVSYSSEDYDDIRETLDDDIRQSCAPGTSKQPLTGDAQPCLEMKERKEHQGRIRSFPHVEGQFATLVYFELHLAQTGPHLSRLLGIFDKGDHVFHRIEPPYHVSLSRTVAIKSIQMRSLISGLKNALKSAIGTAKRKRMRKGMWDLHGSLDVRVGESASILVNDEKTRTFLSLSVSMQGTMSLETVISSVSKVFKLHGLPEYYQDPNIHASVGWCLGNQEKSMQGLLQSSDSQSSLKHLAWSASVTRILCRIGKKEHVVWSNVCH